MNHHLLIAGAILGAVGVGGGFLDGLNTMLNNWETGGGSSRGCFVMAAGLVVAIACIGALIL